MAPKFDQINFLLAMITVIIVAALSFYRGFSLFVVVIRGLVSFLLIYLLGRVLILLWQKVSPESNSPFFDITVGEDLADQNPVQKNKKQTKANETKLPGQINMEGLNKLADSQTQAAVIEKMVGGENK